jgi:hypothetical protein
MPLNSLKRMALMVASMLTGISHCCQNDGLPRNCNGIKNCVSLLPSLALVNVKRRIAIMKSMS